MATDFPTQLETAAKAVAGFLRAAPPDVQESGRPFILALARWADATAETDIAQACRRVAGPILGPLAAGGVKSSARALIDQLAQDATL